MNTKAQTKKLKINTVASMTASLLVATGLFIGTATANAGDNDLWREQVSAASNVSIGSVSVGNGGSSFLDEVRDNHFPYSQNDNSMIQVQGQFISDTDANTGNWFLKAVSPNSYNYGS